MKKNKYVVKQWISTRPRNEAWQVLGFVYAFNGDEAWQKAADAYKWEKISQVVEVSNWIN